MPAEAVIVDDGGSTRIKWNNPGGLGDMPNLLSVEPQTVTSSFNRVRIAYQQEDGTAVNHIDTPFNTKVEIFSYKNQRVLLEKVGANNIRVTVYGFGGAEPQVEAKQSKGKRRYIVSNAGAIEKVEVDSAKVFDTTATPALYTSVVLLPQ